MSEWREITSIACGYGVSLGVDASGRVHLAGEDTFGRADIENVADAIDVAVGSYACYAVRKDGTVVAAGLGEEELSAVKDWQDVVRIAGGYQHIAGLTKGGKVLVAGNAPTA